jgi:hypothetical protein
MISLFLFFYILNEINYSIFFSDLNLVFVFYKDCFFSVNTKDNGRRESETKTEIS